MSDLRLVLIKVFVREFYRTYATLLLITTGFAFGFLSGYEHRMLATYFVSQPLLLSIPFVLWFLYAFLTFNFNTKSLRRKENTFILHLILFSPVKQWLLLSHVFYLQLTPVLLYAAFLVVVAIKLQIFLSIILVFAFSILLHQVQVLAFLYIIRHPFQERSVWLARMVNKTVSKPYPFFALEWLARRKSLLFVSVKAISLILLYAVLKLYHTDEYDARLLGLGLLIVVSLHASLFWELHRLENVYFQIFRQLPLAWIKRLAMMLSCCMIMMLPEMALLLRNFPPHLSLFVLMSSVWFILSIPVLLYGLLFRDDYREDRFMNITFIMVIVEFVIILFNVPLILLALLNLLVGCLFWRRNLYTFESIPEQDAT